LLIVGKNRLPVVRALPTWARETSSEKPSQRHENEWNEEKELKPLGPNKDVEGIANHRGELSQTRRDCQSVMLIGKWFEVTTLLPDEINNVQVFGVCSEFGFLLPSGASYRCLHSCEQELKVFGKMFADLLQGFKVLDVLLILLAAIKIALPILCSYECLR
jgi:hypothetical protein